MGVGDLARKAWQVFTLSNQSAPHTFAQTYTPLDDMWQEMFGGGTTGPVTREQLLAVPAALKARNMICNVATLPLTERDEANNEITSPLFAQFDAQVPNVVHLSQTIEDLFVDAISWWEIVGADQHGYPTKVRRRSDNNVTLNPPAGTKRGRDPLPGGYDPREAVVYVDGRVVPARRMIRFDSPLPAARKVAARTIRRANALDDAASMYANDPRPADYFTPRQGMPDPASDAEIITFLRKWRDWRRKHSTGYVPYAMDYNAVDTPTPVDLQLVQLQERVALDLAISFGLDPSDVGAPVQSMTYANVTDKRQDRINDVLAFFMRAITDRLDMPDVTLPGRHTSFDLDEYMRPDPKTRAEVAQIYNGMGVVGPKWIGHQEGLPPEASAGATVQPAAASSAVAGDNVRQLRAARETFADLTAVHFDLPLSTFAVDERRRVMEGIAVPYGPTAIAYKGGRRYRFEYGSLHWSDTVRVKLLEDHNASLAFGHMTSLVDGPAGLTFAAAVGRGAHGDRMLALAADKVKDGLSVGVAWEDIDAVPDPLNAGVILIRRAQLLEVSQTAMPTFDDARLTYVAASRDPEGSTMPPCQLCGHVHADGVACPPTTGPPVATLPPPAAVPATFSADQVLEFMRLMGGAAAPAVVPAPAAVVPDRPVVDPAGAGGGAAVVREPLPYTFQRGTFAGGRDLQFDVVQPHNFHADMLTMARSRDDGFNGGGGAGTEAGKRVMGLLQETFAIVTTNVDEANPTIQRPDMFVDQRDYRRPIWDLIGRGGPPNGVQPFTFPKYSSSSGLVADHTEGTEPDSGTYVLTGQTVTPTALSGKASLTREVWDMGGNPATASLVFNQMRRGYYEGLESAAATFLNTLTAAADITITTAGTDAQVVADWESAVADAQFIRGYDLDALVLEKVLYKRFGAAKTTTGEPIYPILGANNRNGQAASRFRTLDLAGVLGIPSWALPSTPGSPNNSWWFDPSVVFGWATPPQRLEFPGTDSSGDYAPVAMVDLAIWGYKAFANTDIAGVRQVIHDSVT